MRDKGLRIGVTMREIQADGYDEPRDALARNWGTFLGVVAPEAAWLPIPSLGAERSVEYFERWGLNALILTGGEDVGVAPARDDTERALLRHCLSRDLPVLGVCRGLQLIWLEFGGELETRDGHRAVRHRAKFVDDPELALEKGSVEVNSYHNQCLRVPSVPVSEPPFAFAYAEDGSIEGARFRCGRVVGVMWHPERERMPSRDDVFLIRRLFKLENCVDE
jgi:putative glutamine amidotransferase